MGAAVERVVRHALFEYTDLDTGGRRLAYRGDRIRVAGDDLERGERFEALVKDESALEPVGIAPPPLVAVPLSSAPSEPLDRQRPARTAGKKVWVDFAVARRAAGVEEAAARAEANSLTKPELIERYGETPAPEPAPDSVPTSGDELPSPADAQEPVVPAVEVLDGREVVDGVIVPTTDEEPLDRQRPPRAAVHEAWVNYAVARRAEGVDEAAARAEAESLTKAELIERFGA